MRIVEQSATLESVTPDAALLVERAARTCYKSQDRVAPGSATRLIQSCLERGHTSVLEHASATFRIVTDRGILAELTRHRIASFSVESTRYCKYRDGIAVVRPPGLDPVAAGQWRTAVEAAEKAYTALLAGGVKAEIARSVLPLSLACELVMTANFREWLLILCLRTAKAAHPQMRALMMIIQDQLIKACPEVFA